MGEQDFFVVNGTRKMSPYVIEKTYLRQCEKLNQPYTKGDPHQEKKSGRLGAHDFPGTEEGSYSRPEEQRTGGIGGPEEESVGSDA